MNRLQLGPRELFNTLTSFLVQAHLPFAVVGSVEEVKVGNKTVRARQYPWGVVQGENKQVNQGVCEWVFVFLRQI